MVKEDDRARQQDSSKSVASVEDKLAMQYWARMYVYRERPSMGQAMILQQEGQGKRLPFVVEEGRLRAPKRCQRVSSMVMIETNDSQDCHSGRHDGHNSWSAM